METRQSDFKSEQEPKRGIIIQTDQISKTPHGVKDFLYSVVLRGAEEVRLGDLKEVSYRKLIRSRKGRFTKVFKKSTTCNNGRVDRTKTPSHTNPSTLIYTFLLPLEFL